MGIQNDCFSQFCQNALGNDAMVIKFRWKPKNSCIYTGSGHPVLANINMSKRLFNNKLKHNEHTVCSFRKHRLNNTQLDGNSETSSFHVKLFHNLTWPLLLQLCWQRKNMKTSCRRHRFLSCHKALLISYLDQKIILIAYFIFYTYWLLKDLHKEH